MTTTELIAALQAMPANTRIVLANTDAEAYEFTSRPIALSEDDAAYLALDAGTVIIDIAPVE